MTELSDHLQRLHLESGSLSTRTLATMVGASHTTIADTLNGSRTPTWPMMEKIALALMSENDSIDEVRRLWRQEHYVKRERKLSVKSEVPLAWTRVQWGGSADPVAVEPDHVSTYERIVASGMRPRWYRAVLYGPGRSVATPWVELEESE